MRSLSALSIVLLLAVSCSQNQQKEEQTTAEKAPAEKVKGNKMLTFEIEGMVCVMGCGSSIRSKLAETNAVENCEFDFEEGRKKNIVTVTYDDKKTSPEKIIDIVTKMNDGQFTVGKNKEGDLSLNIKATFQNAPPTPAEENSELRGNI